MMKKLLLCAPLLLSSLFLSGCTTTITNLTPKTQPRNGTGLYPFEMALDTQDASIRRNTIQPYVLIGSETYPMQPTLSLNDRWETLVPVTPDKEYVSYRFKVDYQTRSIPAPTPGSRLSRPFQLQIIDRRPTQP